MAVSEIANRVQAAMNFLQGDETLTALMLGTKRVIIEDVRRLSDPEPIEVRGYSCEFAIFFHEDGPVKTDRKFREKILAHGSEGLHKVRNTTLHYVTVEDPANDAQINNELGGREVFELDDFLAYSAALMCMPLFEGEGPKYKTLFHVRVKAEILAVLVSWDRHRAEVLYAGSGVGNSDFKLHAGTRVILPPSQN